MPRGLGTNRHETNSISHYHSNFHFPFLALKGKRQQYKERVIQATHKLRTHPASCKEHAGGVSAQLILHGMIVPRGGETIFAAAKRHPCALLIGENWFIRAARRIFLSAPQKTFTNPRTVL
jgi:hypothetical protein